MEQDGRSRLRSAGRAGVGTKGVSAAAQLTGAGRATSRNRDRDSGLNALSPRKPAGADMTTLEGLGSAPAHARAWTPAQRARFHALYRDHFDFVYRNLRRLGVAEAAVDDALQDVYLVVLRHIDGYREGTHARAWLFAIAMRVASNYRRAHRRRGTIVPLGGDELDPRPDPFDLAARSQAGRILHAFLDELDDDRRAVFVMAELEQMTAPEIAFALRANVNTVYSRLRMARAELECMVSGLRRRGGQDSAPSAGEPYDE